jgi:signal peptidase I
LNQLFTGVPQSLLVVSKKLTMISSRLNNAWNEERASIALPIPQRKQMVDGNRSPVRHRQRAIARTCWRWRLLHLVMTLLTPRSIWHVLTFVTHSSTPILVVISGQYPFGFKRGDVILSRSIDFNMNNNDDDKNLSFRPGELVSFRANDWISVPHVHRIMEVREERLDGASKQESPQGQQQQQQKEIKILTKGDDNGRDDRGLYNSGQLWLTPNDILGKVWGYVPYLGMPAILLQDYDFLGFFKFLLYARIVYQTLFWNRSIGWIEWSLLTFFFLGQHVCYT